MKQCSQNFWLHIYVQWNSYYNIEATVNCLQSQNTKQNFGKVTVEWICVTVPRENLGNYQWGE